MKISFYFTLAQPVFYYIITIWLQGSTPVQPEIFVSDTILYTLAQPDFHYIRTFQGSTLAQPDFHYIRTFQGSTLAQPEIFIFMVNDIFQATLVHPNFYYIRKNIISVAFSFLLCMYVLLLMHILYLYLCLNQVVAVLKAKKEAGSNFVLLY